MMASSILVIQTCNPNLFEYVVKEVRERYPDSRLTLFLQPQMKEFMSAETLQGCEILVNPKSRKLRILKELRKHKYARAVFVLARDSGYWKLKILPFFLLPAKPVAYDRHARPISLKPVGFVRWVAHSVLAPIRPLISPRGIFRKIAAVPISVWLVAFYFYQRVFHPYRRKSALRASRRK